MSNADRRRGSAADAASPDSQSSADHAPPAPEAQGDGQPAGPAGDVSAASRDDGDASADSVQRQLEDQREKFLRLAAEYDNFRKRSARERAEAGSRAQAELVTRLLESLDDLQRFAHVDPATTDPQTLHKGIELVELKMFKALGDAGLEVIVPLDQTFDPTLHEAISTEPALSPEDDHTVARVFQNGYRFNGLLLRPARVAVKQWNQA